MGRRRSIEKAKENADSTTMMMKRWWLGSRWTSKRSRRVCAVHSTNQIQRPRQTRRTALCLHLHHHRRSLPNQRSQCRSLLPTQHMTTPPILVSRTLLPRHSGHVPTDWHHKDRRMEQDQNRLRLPNPRSHLQSGLCLSDMRQRQTTSQRPPRLRLLMMTRLRMMSYDDTMANEL